MPPAAPPAVYFYSLFSATSWSFFGFRKPAIQTSHYLCNKVATSQAATLQAWLWPRGIWLLKESREVVLRFRLVWPTSLCILGSLCLSCSPTLHHAMRSETAWRPPHHPESRGLSCRQVSMGPRLNCLVQHGLPKVTTAVKNSAAQGWCTGMTWGKGCGGRWEGAFRMYTHGWFMWMYGKNHYNIVK